MEQTQRDFSTELPAPGSPAPQKAGEAERKAASTVHEKGVSGARNHRQRDKTDKRDVVKLESMRPCVWLDLGSQKAEEQSILNPGIDLNTYWKTQRRNRHSGEG